MMMTFPSTKIIGALVAVTLLSACGGAISPSGPPALMPANAKSGALAYVSDGSGSVYVYSYPQFKSVGTLTGFAEPEGLCVDAAGDVWVSDFGAQQMQEFAHGANKPKATLKLDDYQSPFACSVDRKTGDLAVTAWRGNTGPGYISIFKKAKGKAKTLTDSAFVYVNQLAYDPKGNLFIDGTDAANKFAYAELASGADKLTKISIKEDIAYPGGVQYDGKYITVGDAEGGQIYATSGKKVVRTTVVTTSGGPVNGFFIDGAAVICADGTSIQIYKYPAGGTATQSVSVSNSRSVAISNK